MEKCFNKEVKSSIFHPLWLSFTYNGLEQPCDDLNHWMWKWKVASNGNLNGKHVLSVIKLLGIPFSDKPQCCWLYAILSYLNIKCSKALRLSPSIGLIPILSKSHNCWSYPNRPIYYIILYYSIVYYIVLYYIILYYIYIHNIYIYIIYIYIYAHNIYICT